LQIYPDDVTLVGLLDISDMNAKLACIKNLLAGIAPTNKRVLKRVLDLMVKIYKNSSVNKMTTNNLAIVIGMEISH
jgi:hypothetical protein